MSDLDQSGDSQSTQSVHARVVQDRLPSWYDAAALKRKKEFSQTQIAMPQWYKNLSAQRKSTLSAAYERSFKSLNRLDETFNGLQGVVAFSEPLLVAAMKEKFATDYDVKRLFFARETFMPADKSKVFGPEASGYCYYQGMSLLEAALLNFPLDDTLEAADKNASVITRYDFHQSSPRSNFNQSDVLSRRVALEPHLFASLCRELDLGARYLQHVESYVNPVDEPKTNMGATARAVRTLMAGTARSQLMFAAEVALGTGDIQQDAYQLVQQLGRNESQPKWRDKTVSFSNLNFLGQPLEQIIVIGPINIHYPVRGNVVFLNEPCLAFIPGDPVCVLKEYTDLQSLKEHLVERLCLASYRQFFSQFVPYARQGDFFTRLKWHLDPAGAFAEYENYDSSQKNIRTLTASYGTRFSLLWMDYARQKISLMLSNARAMAVSTEAADRRAHNAWLVSLAGIALNVLNVAALFLPQLAPVMLLIGAVQMLQEVVSGVEAWQQGDINGVWAHVSAIVFNVASAVVGAKLLPLVKAPFVESLAHGRCPDGTVRLFAPDLAPYQRQLALPTELTPNEHGLFEHDGGLYLPKDNAYYRVERVGSSNDYKILHPQDPAAYTPRVSRTQAGAWAYEHENPVTFTQAQLMERLGPLAEPFANEPRKLERILEMTATDADTLRKMHADQAALPALLADTFTRLELDSEVAEQAATVRPSERAAQQSTLFAQRYAAAEAAESANVSLVKRAFPALPKRVVEELLEGVSATEIKVLEEGHRVPLRLAEEARHYLQRVRLARAYEGLFRKTLANADTQRMVLHSLDKLPGWPTDLRIDIVERTAGGERVLDSIGPRNAASKRRFIKFGPHSLYEVQDDKFAVLHQQVDIYGAVQAAMSPEQWTAMKLTAHDRGASLKQMLEQLPLMSRDQLRALLKMQPIKPGYKPPMRLADGRVGYPLSPVGGAARRPFMCVMKASELYPSKSIEMVEQMLGLQELDDAALLTKLQELEQDYAQLKAGLNKWYREGGVGALEHRRRVSVSILEAWRRTNEQALSGDGVPIGHVLDLSWERVGDLPPVTANMDHVGSLVLRGMALTDASLPFLKSFGGLRWLNMSDNHLTQLPEFANGGAQLTKLYLSNNDIRLNPQSQTRLEGMQSLKILKLSGNRLLGWSANVQQMRNLNQLYLAGTSTTVFPAGADQLTNLARIDLHSNRITVLPEYAYQHLDRVNLHDNPFSPATRIRLQLDPPLAPIGWGEHIGHDEARELWLHELPAAEQGLRRATWDEVRASPSSDAFFTVLADTTRSAEYSSGLTRPALTERVWDMLDVAKENQAIRESLFATADDRITCGDGSTVEFMNLESELLAAKALELAGTGEAQATLIATARTLFRLRLVDAIAQQDVDLRGPGFTEQVEVILAYRIGLADRLGLPFTSRRMLFSNQANVSQVAIDAAYAQVLVDERVTADESAFFVDRAFWDKHLRSRYSRELAALMEPGVTAIEAKREALEELSEVQGTQDNSADPAAKDAWQARFDEAVEQVATLLAKPRDEILVDGAMQSAFYDSQMRQLGAQRREQETSALQTLTREVLDTFDAAQAMQVTRI